jgi:hypothetical protein
MLPSIYTLNKNEHDSLVKFEQHECHVRRDKPMGVRVFVRFVITNIGVLAQAQCLCGEKKGITDIDNI